jgi:hypothetical protein
MAWNFATMDREFLARFLFEVFDVDASGDLNETECDALARCVHDAETSSTAVTKTVELLKGGAARSITAEVFVRIALENPVLLQPIQRLQLAFRTSLLGKRYFEEATQFRRDTYPRFASISAITRSYERSRERDRDAIMREEFEKSSERRKQLSRDASSARQEAERARWALFGPAQRAQELAQLVLVALQAEAAESLSQARRQGMLRSSDLLGCGELCQAVRRVELQLLECMRLLSPSVEEQKAAARDRLRADAEQEANALFASDPGFRRDAIARRTELVREFRAIVRHGGTGESIIPRDAFRQQSTPALAADPIERAAMTHVVSLLAGDLHVSLVQAEAARLEEARRMQVSSLGAALTRLLTEHGIDDSDVSHSLWRRGYDPVGRQYFWEKRAVPDQAVEQPRVYAPPASRQPDAHPKSSRPWDDHANEPTETACTGMVRAADIGFLAADAGASVPDFVPVLPAQTAPGSAKDVAGDALFGLKRVASPHSVVTPARSRVASTALNTDSRWGEALRSRRKPPKPLAPAPRRPVAVVGAVHPAERGLAALIAGKHADGTAAPVLFHGSAKATAKELGLPQYRHTSTLPPGTESRPHAMMLGDAAAVLDAMRHEEAVAPV